MPPRLPTRAQPLFCSDGLAVYPDHVRVDGRRVARIAAGTRARVVEKRQSAAWFMLGWLLSLVGVLVALGFDAQAPSLWTGAALMAAGSATVHAYYRACTRSLLLRDGPDEWLLAAYSMPFGDEADRLHEAKRAITQAAMGLQRAAQHGPAPAAPPPRPQAEALTA